ncbi:MAG: hypothetical protein WCR30_00655 [Clostridia bacterium]
MFIEKLSEEDIVNFVKEQINKNYKIKIELPKSIVKSKYMSDTFVYNFEPIKRLNNSIIVKAEGKCLTKDKEKFSYRNNEMFYTFRDFDYDYNMVIRLKKEPQIEWLKFMYSKFGEDYKKAFVENRKELKTEKNNTIDEMTKLAVKNSMESYVFDN